MLVPCVTYQFEIIAGGLVGVVKVEDGIPFTNTVLIGLRLAGGLYDQYVLLATHAAHVCFGLVVTIRHICLRSLGPREIVGALNGALEDR